MRTVVVTGASSGIGLACARAFLSRGDAVVAQYRSAAEPVEVLRNEFGASKVVPVQADLGSEAGCVQVLAGAETVSVLVHAAGIWKEAPIGSVSREALEEMFRVNTLSAYYLARETVTRMPAGCMVFVGSTAGQRGEPRHSHYAGSKAALWGLVQSLAQELAPRIRVNLVSPGWVRTSMAESALAQPGRYERIVGGIPLQRVADVEDVVSAVMFLADEKQRHLTGVDLPVSGGALLPMPRG